MSMVRALWIDSEAHFINHFNESLKDEIRIRHLSQVGDDSFKDIQWNDIDLVFMELLLQDQNTLKFIPKIREKKTNLPIVIVTAHACKQTCIDALNAGVNGIAEKPLDGTALKGFLKKHCSSRFELVMSHERKAVLSGQSWVDLTSTEYRILEALKSAGRRLTRSELQTAVWPNSTISENNLDTHLTNLKKKIPELNQRLNVKRGLGYYLDLH